MNKELFVSSTPHETKVGLVEDDLLAEVYLERENEYTLAGSIYKGRVTRVLPGMQSAFVDIGLERDAFLYVSDFMELEDHDEDVTDVIPANRAVQDLRSQSDGAAESSGSEGQSSSDAEPETDSRDAGESNQARDAEVQTGAAAPAERHSAGEPQERERGWRGRRRRRGGRRDGRSEGRDRGFDSRPVRPAGEGPSPSSSFRTSESGRSQYGPPPGYQPILLPGESISKYRGMSQPEPPHTDQESGASFSGEGTGESTTPVTSAFPEDEPIFANSAGEEDQTGETLFNAAETAEPTGAAETSTPVDWSQELRGPDPEGVVEFENEREPQKSIERGLIEVEHETGAPSMSGIPAFASPGTIEEETIDEDEADAVQYEGSVDEGYEEFEEETRAAGDDANGGHVIPDVRETVTEIHLSSLAESGVVHAEGAHEPEGEEDSEEYELEEAQAEAEAMLDAEARGNGTVDARAEVRASSGTAGYTQRVPRPRPAYERRGGRRGGRRFPRRQSQEVPKISDLLKEGQEILVQIAKEPIGKKGARITSHIALPGRFLVYMPTVNHTGVSRKIASDEERQRLKRIVMSERENGHGGFIVRTAAQNASEDELRADIRFLKGLWNDIKTRAESSKPPALIYHDLNVVERVLRDQVTSDFSVIWVDTEPEYERILRFFNRFQPGLVKRVKLYTKETPLFEQFGLADEMNKALKSKVWLKSGGYIVINQTEALVAIDINTGKYVGKTARLEDTIVKTNVDAVKEIVRQIRLRDLGGIIIIDFIDMDERRNRQRVMQALEEELGHDRAPSKVLQFNDFGLVAITRKRVKQSLERTIGAPCPYCQSTGYVKSVTTVCNEIYVEMRKISKHLEHEDVMLRVNPDVAKELKGNNGRLLNEMEELTKRTIIVKSDPALHQEQFDIN